VGKKYTTEQTSKRKENDKRAAERRKEEGTKMLCPFCARDGSNDPKGKMRKLCFGRKNFKGHMRNKHKDDYDKVLLALSASPSNVALTCRHLFNKLDIAFMRDELLIHEHIIKEVS
jgi:hypothetical protein